MAPITHPTDDALAVSTSVLVRVHGIEIRTRRMASSFVAGNYRSVFRGQGIEFAEAREYVPGDDVRRIDWNVTARMGTPWVKEFVEEREMTVICAVDRSSSAFVARPDRGRLQAAAELTALLGFAAAHNHDRTGLLTFSNGVDAFVPPQHGPRHVLRLIRDVLQEYDRPRRTTRIAPALEYMGRILRRRSAVFLISDFFDDGYARALQTLSRRHEVIALPLVDPLDLELPDVGLLEFEDAEHGERVLLDTSRADVRRRYAEAAVARIARRQSTFEAAGVDEIEIRLDRDVVEPVAAYFRRRALAR